MILGFKKAYDGVSWEWEVIIEKVESFTKEDNRNLGYQCTICIYINVQIEFKHFSKNVH